jgi:hypothetical protein
MTHETPAWLHAYHEELLLAAWSSEHFILVRFAVWREKIRELRLKENCIAKTSNK